MKYVCTSVPSVGTLILALAGLELSYDHLYKQACWLFEISFLSTLWNFCLFVHAKDKSPEDGGMKRKFKSVRGRLSPQVCRHSLDSQQN